MRPAVCADNESEMNREFDNPRVMVVIFAVVIVVFAAVLFVTHDSNGGGQSARVAAAPSPENQLHALMVKDGEVASFTVDGCVSHDIPVVRGGVTATSGYDCNVYWDDGSGQRQYHLALLNGVPWVEYAFAE
jgi:hypothetical protein